MNESAELVEANDASRGELISNKKRQKRIFGVVGVASTFLTGGFGAFGQCYSGDFFAVPKVALGFITEHGADRVSDEVMSRINEIAAEPTNPELIDIMNSDDSQRYELYYNYCLEQAELAGVTLVDPRPYIARVDNANTVADVMAVVSEYTQNLGGFETGLHQPNPILDFGIDLEPVKLDGIKLGELKEGARSVLKILGSMPGEAYRFANIRGIEIVGRLTKVDNDVIDNFEPAATTSIGAGVIYLSIESLYNEDGNVNLTAELMHEIGHILDNRMNGIWGMERDNEFGNINPSFRYGNPNNRENKNNVVTLYGATNITEDKATLYQRILDINNGNLLHDSRPVVSEKGHMLLGRLETFVPGIAKYRQAVSLPPGVSISVHNEGLNDPSSYETAIK